MRAFVCGLFLVGMFASCDQCDPTECTNGACEERVCVCEDGYLGQRCDLQAKPESITITEVRIENVPEALFTSKVWDDDTSTSIAKFPDVILQMRMGTSQDLLFTSRERYFDTKETSFVFDDNVKAEIVGDYPELRMTLADLDVPKPEPIYVIVVKDIYSPIARFPETLEGVDENGVGYFLRLEYNH